MVRSGWVSQRECARCSGCFPEAECMRIGVSSYDYIVLTPMDQATDLTAVVCRACAADLASVPHELLVPVVRDLVEVA